MRARGPGSIVVLAFVFAAVVQPTPAAGGTAAISPRLVDHAREFRTHFGFPSDPETVKSSFEAEGFNADEYGVPLSASELKDLENRSLRHEAFMNGLETINELPEYAGAYVDQLRGGQPVILSTDPEATQGAIVSRGIDLAGSEIRLASRTMKELTDLRDSLEGAISKDGVAGQEVVSLGIRVRDNRVSIGVSGDLEKAASALEVYGPSVVVFEDEPAVLDACTNMSSCWPMKGGLRIRLTSNPGPSICTSGFLAKRTDTSALVVVTAGHCLALNDSSGSDYWGHASSPAHAVNMGAELGHTWWEYSNADVGLISLDAGSVADLSGVSKNVSHYQDPTTTESVLSVRSPSNQVTGILVCRKGYGTFLDTDQGKTCDQIGADTDVTKKSCKGPGTTEPCSWIKHQWEVDFDSTGGDSGGPVTFKSFGSPYPHLVAFGTHVHSDRDDATNPIGWYSPVAWGASQYNQPFFSYSYSICITSSC